MASLRKLLRKPAAVLGGLMLLVLLAGILAVVFLDAPPVDDSDMAVAYVDVPKEENAYPILVELAGLVDRRGPTWEIEEKLGEGGWDRSLVLAFLAANADLFQLFDRAAAKPWVQPPPDRGVEGYFDGPLRPLIYFSAAVQIRTEFLRREGRLDEAWESIRSQILLGRRIRASGENGYFAATTGSVMVGVAWIHLRTLAGTPGLKEEDLRLYQDFLTEGEGKHLSLAEAVRLEAEAVKRNYAFLCGLVDQVSSGGAGGVWDELRGGDPVLPRCLAKPNLTRRDFLPQYRALLDALSAVEAGSASLDDPEFQEPEPDFWYFLSPNRTGRYIGVSTGFMLYHFQYLWHHTDAALDHRMTIVHLALHRYRLRHGAFPDALDDLVPAFLDAVPADPVSGVPMRYSRDRERVWTVGRDGVDQGGQDFDDVPFYRLGFEEDPDPVDPDNDDVTYPLFLHTWPEEKEQSEEIEGRD